MSSLGDRVKIMRQAAWPDYNVAIQYILNCGTEVAGSCDGGFASGAFQFAQEKGIPLDTCQQYKAEDDSCTAENTCRNCAGPPGSGTWYVCVCVCVCECVVCVLVYALYVCVCVC